MSGPGYASFHSGPPGASFRLRAAAGDAAAVPPPATAPAAAAPAKKASKPRLPSLDSLRFFLIAYIGVGHFVAFATRDAFLLKLFTQINVWVGAFFVLSGYVAGYTATEVGVWVYVCVCVGMLWWCVCVGGVLAAVGRGRGVLAGVIWRQQIVGTAKH